MNKFILVSFVLSCLILLIGKSNGQRVKRSVKENWCENSKEFSRCKKACYKDRDCNDDTNLNCSDVCKKACLRLEKVGRCRAILLASLLKGRGRLNHGL